jgi:hypothetical protein
VQENIISWNLANWVSVVLMALIGFFLLGSAMAFIKKGKSASAAVTPNQSPQQPD